LLSRHEPLIVSVIGVSGVSWTLRPSDSALFQLVRIQRREDVTVEPKLEAGVVEFVGSLAQ